MTASASLLAAACVSQGRYDAAVQEANAARAELAKTRQGMQRREKTAEEGRAEMQEHLDELDELRLAHIAAEARASFYRELALRFNSMIDVGDLAITVRDGRMVLRLSNDVLFDSGRSELKPEGKRALSEVAAVLVTIPNRQFQVSGHTDDEPIRLSPYRSNWDLSTARALEVTSFLVSKGVNPHALSAAGYGEFDPIDTNATSGGRARNRRTEIALQPDIDDIAPVPSSP